MRKYNLSPHQLFKTTALSLTFVFIFIRSISQTYTIDTIMRNGERHNRINIVYLSDGYLNTELSNFVTTATNIHNSLFSQSPFLQYKNYFNSYAIRVPSPESGAKHPGNALDESTSPGQPITNPNNNFQSTFDYGLTHRSLVAQNGGGMVSTLVNNFPDYTQAFVIVNSPFYGGSGGPFAVSSAHADASEITIHEFGHSFANLADEYLGDPFFPAETANMTANSDPSTIKWKTWLGTNDIGIYPYSTVGIPANWYRPHLDCKMRFLFAPFCSVCIERFIDVIHQKVNTIDTHTPSATSFVLADKNPVPFSVTAIQTDPSTISINWYLNNSPTPFSTNSYSISIPFSSFQVGDNTVRAEVVDNNSLSRSYLPGVGYVNNLTWTVNLPLALPVYLKSFSGKMNDDEAILNWEIDSPDDLQIFELEKSIDGLLFTKLASIEGQQFKNNYTYTDKRTFRPYTYYRLRTIEKNGFAHYSKIIRLQNSFDKFYYKVYQDAGSHRYHLSLAITQPQRISYTISDIQGKIILKKDFGEIKQQLEHDFHLTEQPSGIYLMTLFVGNSKYTTQLLAK